MSSRTSLLLLPALAAFALGCASEAPTGDVASSRAPIINGTLSDASDDSAIWLGILSKDGYLQGSCSGTLIADNLVLTARHCTASTQEGGIACSKAGAPVSGGKVLSNYDATNLAVIVGPKMKQTADAWGTVIVDNAAGNLCDNDIALVVLDRHITSATIARIRLDAPPVKGATMRAVGWGITNKSSGGMTSRRMRRTGIPIVAVGPAVHNGAIGPNEFGVGESICSGDSGGPAFDETTGAVIGVVSRGGNGAPYDPNTDPEWTPCVDQTGYETSNLYTRTDTFRDLILSAFAQAGSEPWVEGGPDPRLAKAGQACDGADACRSGLCAEVNGASQCVDPCDATSNACGRGYACRPAGAASGCVPVALADDTTTIAGGGCAMERPQQADRRLALVGIGAIAAFVLRARTKPRTRG
jgi:secreted trypsin-like serine protease